MFYGTRDFSPFPFPTSSHSACGGCCGCVTAVDHRRLLTFSAQPRAASKDVSGEFRSFSLSLSHSLCLNGISAAARVTICRARPSAWAAFFFSHVIIAHRCMRRVSTPSSFYVLDGFSGKAHKREVLKLLGGVATHAIVEQAVRDMHDLLIYLYYRLAYNIIIL
ncbi:uncharacterized protein LOC125203471 [Salvia hispanica]|uniref:uncharacterized protein LOC125203471 n=1 Tax=Salvia hispanica TaxID=49212 RepID=UPI002009BF31|nr:uncharacterized protein LOC125203471 [Salvia hispanica]